MGAGCHVLLRSFLFFAALTFTLCEFSEARPRVIQSSCRSCGSGQSCSGPSCSGPSCSGPSCGGQSCSGQSCGGQSCSGQSCGGQQGVICQNGSCSSVGGPFQQGQFVGTPQQGTGTFQSPQTGTHTSTSQPTAAPAQPAATPASNATSSAREGNKEMRVVNSEPVDITQFSKKDGKTLDRVMLNPNTPLYVKMKWDKSDGGIFRTFLIDPVTFTAYGKGNDKLIEFNFNDPYEKQSLAQVKTHLKGMQLDATLWGFLKKYWPNEDFGPQPSAPAQTQVADSRPNPTDGISHVGTQGPDARRPEAPSRQTAGTDRSSSQARQSDSLRGKPPGAQTVSYNPSSSSSSSSSTSSSPGGAKVIVRVFKMSDRLNDCGACDRLHQDAASIKDYDAIGWYTPSTQGWRAQNRYPTTVITVEKDGKALDTQTVVGNAPNAINEKITKARAVAKRN